MSRNNPIPYVGWFSSREISLYNKRWVRKDDVKKWALLLSKDKNTSSTDFEVLKFLQEEE
tara:strand:- start:318 stop:497 length:180 start_codon:yes stop_codon:yes gene_type:complete